MTEFFPFADLVEQFEGPLTAIIPGRQDVFTDSGRKIPQPETTLEFTGALVPMRPNQLNRQENGNYTDKDRQLFTVTPLKTGTVVVQDGKRYKIDRENPYQPWTDVYIYYARGIEK